MRKRTRVTQTSTVFQLQCLKTICCEPVYSNRPLATYTHTAFLENGSLLATGVKAMAGANPGAPVYDGMMKFWVPRESRHI